MKRKNEVHELVLQCLTEALLKLMEKKPFNEISVSELCEKAGVARASFYRNYDSMQEILTNYLSSVTDEWWEEFVKYPEDEFHEKFWKELLLQYKKNEELIKLIYQNDISYIIKNHIFNSCGPKDGQDEQTKYLCAMVAGAIYGFVEQWIVLGMNDIPDTINMRSFLKFGSEYKVVSFDEK